MRRDLFQSLSFSYQKMIACSKKTFLIAPLIMLLMLLFAGDASAQTQAQKLDPNVVRQIQSLMEEKALRTPAQKKMSSHLLYAFKMRNGQRITAEVATLEVDVVKDAQGRVKTELDAAVSTQLLDQLKALGCEILLTTEKYGSILANIPLDKLEAVAELAAVKHLNHWVAPMNNSERHTKAGKSVTDGGGLNDKFSPAFNKKADNVRKQLDNAFKQKASNGKFFFEGSVISEADVTHKADQARATFGTDGSGVKIGVMSNGVAGFATAIASGDLPPFTILPGQAGTGSEGWAMMELIHDLAPGAELFFATANPTQAQFAQNILDLRAAGCDIIVDDVSYFAEGVFQDDNVAQAVNTVTASGALYFSSAGNSGNENDNTSGVWEGDFADGGAGTGILAGGGQVHNFSGGTLYNTLTLAGRVTLKWSDQLGLSANDYDMYALNAAGTAIAASAANVQDGNDNPYEDLANRVAGQRIVIVKFAGADRALHLNTNRGLLTFHTPGVIYGHNAAASAYTVAATPTSVAFGGTASTTGPYPGVFNSGNKVEGFSSDGPRRMFYNPDGSPITPGNILFNTNGGALLAKPDITAGDGSVTTTPGFIPFFGTSAAAPHAAAIAALIKSKLPSLTPAQIRTALITSAIDIEAPGFDRDAGAGIIMAYEALLAAGATAVSNITLGTVTAVEVAGNGNGVIEPDDQASMTVQLKDLSTITSTNVNAVLTTSTPGITITQNAANYGDIAGNSSAVNTETPFLFTVGPQVPCATIINFTLTVTYGGGGVSPKVFNFTVNTGSQITPTIVAALGTALPAGTGYVASQGIQTNRTFRGGVISTCAAPKAQPGVSAAPNLNYHAYNFTNPTPISQCVTVNVSTAGANTHYAVAYNNSGFIPATPASNYLADPGASSTNQTFSFNAPPGQQFTVVVHELAANAAVGIPYNLNVNLRGCAPPTAPVISIDNVTHNEGNSGTTTYTFTVSLSKPAPAGGVSFTIATDNNSAIAPGDYIHNGLTGQTIAEGNSTYTFDVLVNGDTQVEGDEVFNVRLSDVVGATIGDDTGDGTIINDDAAIATSLTLDPTSPNCTNAIATFTATLNRTSAPAGPLAGQTVSFSLSGPTNLTYNAVTNNAGVATIQTLLTTAGSYTVTASFTAAGYVSSNDVITHTVNPVPPIPTVTAGGPTTFCNGNSVTLNSSAAAGNQWYKDGNAISGATGQSLVVTTSGDYSVMVTLNGCSAQAPSGTITVTVNPGPSTPAAINAGGPTTFCLGGSVTLSTSGASSYQWYKDGNPIGGATFASYIATATGNYTVVAVLGGCMSAPTTAVSVTAAPDVTAPVAPVLPNILAQCSVTELTAPTATDNCVGIVTGTTTATLPITAQGTTVVTWTFNDGNGNTSTAMQNVIIDDITPPVAPTSLPVINATCSVASLTAPTASDNCGATITGTTLTAFPITAEGTTLVTWTFNDGNGNTSTATQNVVIDDITPPVAPTSLPPVIGACSVTPTAPTANDDCVGTVTGTTTTPFPITTPGTTVITWTFNDGRGNSSTATQSVSVTGGGAPTMTCPANISSGTTGNNCTATISVTGGSASVGCGTITAVTWTMSGATTGSSPATGINVVGTKTFNTGITTITYTATASNGATASCSFTVTVTDNQGPTLTCPAAITQNVTGSACSRQITVPNAAATDNCGTVTSLTWVMTGATTGTSPATGTNNVGTKTFNVGTTTITYTAKDAGGNTSTCSFTVKVTETVLPTITCPGNRTVNSDYGLCGFNSINLTTPTVSDNCGIASVTHNAPSILPLGATTVTWTVTDKSGNTRTCSQVLTVVDAQNPEVTSPANIAVNTGAGTCSASVATPNPTYFDNCGVTRLTWVMTGATTGSSPTTGFNNVGTKTFNKGLTTITYTVRDAAGRTGSSSFAVTVTDNERPSLSCPGNITQTASNGSCGRSIAVTNPTYADNCGVTKVTWFMTGATQLSSSMNGVNLIGTKTFNVGVTTVTYSIWDAADNTRSCTFTVTITDNQAPVVTCPSNRTLCKKANNSYSIPALVASDNCGIASTTYVITGATSRSGNGLSASGTYNLGVSTIRWTVTDFNGLVTTCTTTVTIVPSGNCDNARTAEPSNQVTLEEKAGGVVVEKIEAIAFPNPSGSYFNLQVRSNKKETVLITMYDMLGKVVEVQRGAAGHTYKFGANVVSGMYMIEVKQGGETTMVKVLKN